MTRVADRKTILQAETSACYRGRALVVTVEAHAVVMREKIRGHRAPSYTVPWLLVYEMGMKLAAEETRRAKRGAR